ncbi:uncharacterized protein LOC113749979 [Coffea eugenioides]|uniref:uncharacterized protein LOC113749979 n=1 Tax=Coffea eugenioides TaxID=49369 RepID=UPI000F60E0E4|nr:uncharacterized protein LOC113749979 [Coffea eugenioides]
MSFYTQQKKFFELRRRFSSPPPPLLRSLKLRTTNNNHHRHFAFYTVFGELAEGLLKMTALEAMEYYDKKIDLPLDKVHKELKTKMFIVQIKPGTTKEGNSHKRYTIEYYFEDTSEIKSIEYPEENSTQHKHIEDKQPSSPKARIRLEARFEESETKQQRFSDMNSIEYAKENSSQNVSTATNATVTMISQSGKEHSSSKPKMLLQTGSQESLDKQQDVLDVDGFTSNKKPRNI